MYAKSDFTRTYTRLFSSRSIENVGHTFIIRNNTVILQRKSDILTTAERREQIRIKEERIRLATEEAEKKGLPPPEFKDDPEKMQKGVYQYMQPPNGCHLLENGFDFCCYNGQIVRVNAEPFSLTLMKDYFFYNESHVCKIAKYNFMYNFLFKGRVVKFHHYQFATPLSFYPSLLKVIIISEDDFFDPEDLEALAIASSPLAKHGIDHNFTGKLIALYLSDRMEIGCLPFDKLKLYDSDESILYPLYLTEYKLLGPWIKNIDFNDSVYITVQGPFVKEYLFAQKISEADLPMVQKN